MRAAQIASPTAVIVCAYLLAGVAPAGGQDRPPKDEPKVALTADEEALVADVAEGNFAGRSFAEASLIASGVTDPAKRKAYLDRLDSLEKQARAAVGDGTPTEKGRKLLAWLYAPGGPIGPGGPGKKRMYQPGQSSLAVLLDTGHYNCASVTTLYNVLGRRLGLDLRAVESPDHVFSILHDGDAHVDVETTTPRGFDPVRDRAAQKELKDLGLVHIPARNRKKQREVGEAGLAAILYANRSVDLGKEKRYPESYRLAVVALRLDPGFEGARGNALAALEKWAGAAAEGGEPERVRAIVRGNVGLLKDPAAEAKVLAVAYDARGRKLRTAKDWPALADYYATALGWHRDDKGAGDHLRKNARFGYDKWAEPKVKAGKWREAAEVYEAALKKLPGDEHLEDQLGFCRRKDQSPVPKPH